LSLSSLKPKPFTTATPYCSDIDNVLKPSFFYRSVIDLFEGPTPAKSRLIAGLEDTIVDGTHVILPPDERRFQIFPSRNDFPLIQPGNADLVESITTPLKLSLPSNLLANGVGLDDPSDATVSSVLWEGLSW
jgi:hypothetical protein